eukprot:2479973-Pleurochrysis_carterae.AAC.2
MPPLMLIRNKVAETGTAIVAMSDDTMSQCHYCVLSNCRNPPKVRSTDAAACRLQPRQYDARYTDQAERLA